MSKIKYAKGTSKRCRENELLDTESACETQQWCSLLEVIYKQFLRIVL